MSHGWICYERFYVRKKRNPWLIRGHPCEELSPWPAVVCFNLRLCFTRIITDCVTDGFVTNFFVWKEKTVTHPWTSVWRVVSMILSSVLQAEITFHTDYHGVGHGWICYELFHVRKKKSVTNPWTSVWSVVAMIRSLIVCRDDTSMRGK